METQARSWKLKQSLTHLLFEERQSHELKKCSKLKVKSKYPETYELT